MRIALLTSDNLRHKYIANAVSEHLCLIVTEAKSEKIQDTSSYGKKDTAFLQAHFRAREESEKRFFGEAKNFPEAVPLLQVPHGSINGETTVDAITEQKPDVLLLFGTSIIKEPLLSNYKDRIINLHLGLSPYYRGSATNLYPYLFEEPECIGATIHIATATVDEGGILHQLRPHMKETDSLHDIGNRTIFEAGKILPQVIKAYSRGNIIPVVPKGKGRLCRNKDITPYVLRKIYKNFEEGMISRYLKHKQKKDAKKPIVKQVEIGPEGTASQLDDKIS